MITHKVSGHDFEIQDGINGITVSGGADSALALYFLLKYSETPVHIFTLACLGKQNTNARATVNIISKCAELTDNYNFIQHVTYMRTQNIDILLETPRKYIAGGIINTLYSGQTKNPPHEVNESFSDNTTETVNRDPDVVRDPHIGPHYLPWTNLDKQDIAKIYRDHDLMDSLFPLTRSCEWQPDIGFGPDPGDEHCGKCWWCSEREWGFGKLR